MGVLLFIEIRFLFLFPIPLFSSLQWTPPTAQEEEGAVDQEEGDKARGTWLAEGPDPKVAGEELQVSSQRERGSSTVGYGQLRCSACCGII